MSFLTILKDGVRKNKLLKSPNAHFVVCMQDTAGIGISEGEKDREKERDRCLFLQNLADTGINFARTRERICFILCIMGIIMLRTHFYVILLQSNNRLLNFMFFPLKVRGYFWVITFI